MDDEVAVLMVCISETPLADLMGASEVGALAVHSVVASVAPTDERAVVLLVV